MAEIWASKWKTGAGSMHSTPPCPRADGAKLLTAMQIWRTRPPQLGCKSDELLCYPSLSKGGSNARPLSTCGKCEEGHDKGNGPELSPGTACILASPPGPANPQKCWAACLLWAAGCSRPPFAYQLQGKVTPVCDKARKRARLQTFAHSWYPWGPHLGGKAGQEDAHPCPPWARARPKNTPMSA